MQLLKQPQGRYHDVFMRAPHMWTTEVLSLQGGLNGTTAEHETRPPAELLRQLRGASGRACVPTNCTFSCCMSCGDDTPVLRRACAAHTRWRLQQDRRGYKVGTRCRRCG